jgi:tryptophan-rich sensory protein
MGVAFYAGVWGVSAGLRRLAGSGRSRRQDQRYYRHTKLPTWAPPAAAFPVAWDINAACLIAGGVHVLNLPRRTPGRRAFLQRQGAAWALFCTFDAAYFGLRSPLNAAAVTTAYSAATLASLAAARRMRDDFATASLATTLAWLALATPLGWTQAAWNRDQFWKLGPFLAPPRGGVKRPAA